MIAGRKNRRAEVHLSPTQIRILDAYERGQRHKQTAGQLGISISTVKTHVRFILLRMGAASMVEAAYKRRLLVESAKPLRIERSSA